MGAIHESLRLYLLVKSMKWAHLPVAGGLYDQHPKMLDDFLTIMQIEGQAEKRKNSQNMGGKKAPSALGRKGRRR